MSSYQQAVFWPIQRMILAVERMVFWGIGEGDFQSVIMSPLISILNLGYTFRIAFRSSLRRALKWRGDLDIRSEDPLQSA